MAYKSILRRNSDLCRRRRFSLSQIAKLKKRINSLSILKRHPEVSVFVAGSYGRLEAGQNSDLDMFVVSSNPETRRLDEVRLLSALADVNDALGFPEFSGDMRFYRLYRADDLIANTGKPIDDTENSFTARMLLLLESRCIAGDANFNGVVESVVANYFRDNKGKKDFRPLFLLNDLLRYWRTLCLNYESSRDDSQKPWRKKNLNLKFSRLLTVFSTVTALLVVKPHRKEEFLPLIPMTPFERLAKGLKEMSATKECGTLPSFEVLLSDYLWFLNLKDTCGSEELLSDQSAEARKRAQQVSDFFAELLANGTLKQYARYLTL